MPRLKPINNAAIVPQLVPSLTKNISISSVRSAGVTEDGEAWSCVVKLDGVAIGTFFEHGTGGPADIKIKDESLAAKLEEWACRLYGFTGSSENLSLVIEHLRDRHELQKAANSGARRGYECAMLIFGKPERSRVVEDVPGMEFYRTHFSDQRILLIPRLNMAEQVAREEGAVYYLVAEPRVAERR